MAEQIEMLFGFLIRTGWMKPRRCGLMSNYFDHLLFIIRPHRSTMYVDVAHCYRPSSMVMFVGLLVGLSVSLSVCHSSESCKNGWTDQDAVSDAELRGQRKPYIRWGTDASAGRALLGECMAHCKAYDVGSLSYFMGLRHPLLTLQWGIPYNSLSIVIIIIIIRFVKRQNVKRLPWR